MPRVGEPLFPPLDPISGAILDSLPLHIAVVNAEGAITIINEAWAKFARDNGDPELRYTGVGANYFAVCQQVSGSSAAEAQQALAGILAVKSGETATFEFEYPCHSAHEERWFLMRVRSLAGVPGSLVISHMNMTERKRIAQAEAEAREHAAKVAQLEEELRWFERLFGSGVMLVTARTFGLSPVREENPEIFHELVQRYETILELALEQRAYRIEHRLTEQLRLLGEQFGFLRAGPRDVIEVHRTALYNKTANVPGQKAQAYAHEGRLLTIELMGNLVLYYRNLTMGRRSPTSEQDTNTGKEEHGE